MAHFYGSAHGDRGRVTRCGTKRSGYNTIAASWEGAVNVRLFYSEEHDEDWAIVRLSKHEGSGSEITLYHGPVSGRDYEKFKEK